MICVDTTRFFKGMDQSYVVGVTPKAAYDALLYRQDGYSKYIDAYWAAHPDGALIGDGIHLNRAGQIRFTSEIAKQVAAALGRTLPDAVATAQPSP